MLRVDRQDIATFQRVAGPWLMQAEAEHSLLLGIVAELAEPRHRYDGAPYLALVRDGDVIEGCAFRTPPYKLGLTRMSRAAAEAVAADVAEVFGALPAVMGPPMAARAFATAWCERHGGVPELAMRQGIFELTAVAPPVRPAAGSMRPARPGELGLLAAWCHEFATEAGTPIGDPARTAAHFIDRAEMVVWDDAGACTMAVASGPTPTGIRIGLVYTPPSLRGRGYATALVAELSAAQLRAGRRACFLYTDLANPTSNGIYRRLGYRQVAEAIDVILGSPPT